jgi:hypothetical protein
MLRDEAIRKLREHEAELRQLGVQHLYLFGSTARGEAGEDSDVDLFFDYERGKLGLFELMDVKKMPCGSVMSSSCGTLRPRCGLKIASATTDVHEP